MKKIILFLTWALLAFLTTNAQKENGIVYSEHDAIAKTKAMWAAFIKGDKETFISFFADTVNMNTNGVTYKKLRKNFASNVEWWQGVMNLTIKDDTPAFPDAIQYKKGGLWVQDWLRATGIHKITGINIDFPFHNLYRFNNEGKINVLVQYFNPEIFTEVNNSERTIENGKVYINHPYIVTVRKCVNAYCARDEEALAGFYSPKAIFWKSDFKANKTINLEEKMKENRETFSNYDNITLKQVGYPDCIYYAKDDNYVVFSWWELSFTTKDGKKKSNIPIMMYHGFDKDGKIALEFIYLSSNHFQ